MTGKLHLDWLFRMNLKREKPVSEQNILDSQPFGVNETVGDPS